MKKQFILAGLFIFASLFSLAQISIYVKLTAYDGRVLNTSGVYEASNPINNNTIEAKSGQFIKVSTYNHDVVQTLGIGSQSTGAGAGRITFDPMSVTKTMDATTPILFQNCASGTPFKTAEVFFVNGENSIVNKVTFKLAAIKTIAWSAQCTSGCSAVNEVVAFETGGQIITISKNGEGKSVQTQGGWNRVKNTVDNDPATILQ